MQNFLANIVTTTYFICYSLIFSAPSSSPVNVQFNEVTSTSFVLSWTAPQPEDHNGLLRHYLVSCTEQESGSTFQRPTTNSTTVSLVDSLHPFYSYTCAVAAVTLVEGPFSPSVTVTTTQDGNGSTYLSLCMCVSYFKLPPH